MKDFVIVYFKGFNDFLGRKRKRTFKDKRKQDIYNRGFKDAVEFVEDSELIK